MKLTAQDIAGMMDLSVVRADDDEIRVRELARQAAVLNCAVATALPHYTALLLRLMAGTPSVGVSGNVGFPSGGSTRRIKTLEAKELVKMGCSELDMVVNIGLLRSGDLNAVEEEVSSVVAVAGGRPVKAILECHYLTADQIKAGCESCVRAGVAFIKTGTGWAPSGATLENVALIQSCVGDAVAIKASGGIRDLDTLIAMYRRGARRFGIGLGKEEAILRECAGRPGAAVEV